jgi:ZIP family zinc transporter
MIDMTAPNVLAAFGLTLFAGAATAVGSALAFFAKRTNTSFLCASLGFSAGVMIYVSFVEIFQKAREALVPALGESVGTWTAVGAFFGGIFLTALIDKLVPSYENPHETRRIEEMQTAAAAQDLSRLYRMGLLAALAIGVHNFPEGLATFMDPSLGVAIAVAVAIHNVPEGIAVSVPIYYATGSRRKAFGLSALSGLAEPVGALAGFILLRNLFDDLVFGVLFAAVAGIMVFISLDQLLPAAEEYGEHHIAIYGLVIGMAVMALSLLLFM